MRIKELLQLAIDKKISYGDALVKLKDMRLPEDEQEDYEIMLHKLLGNEEKVLHNPVYQLHAVPNESYLVILQDTIKKVREGWFSPEICQYLYDTFMLDQQIMSYFLNEAISIVRMNNIAPEEVAQIGEAYYKVKRRLEQREERKAIRTKKPAKEVDPKQIQVQTSQEDINAQEIDEIEFQEVEN